MKIGPYKVIKVEENGAIVCETEYPTTEGKRIRFPPYHEYSKQAIEELKLREKENEDQDQTTS